MAGFIVRGSAPAMLVGVICKTGWMQKSKAAKIHICDPRLMRLSDRQRP
jgi:hypothetical protein